MVSPSASLRTGSAKQAGCDFNLPTTSIQRFFASLRMIMPVVVWCFNASTLLRLGPFPHLLREWALRTIGIVLHTKIFVDLKQTLLMRDGFQKFLSARIISKKTCGSCFEPPIRQLCWQICVFIPKTRGRRTRSLEIVCHPKGEQHIRQNVGDA